MPARASLLAVFALTMPGAALGEPSAPRVERDAGAESCPDERELTARIEVIQGRAASAELSTYSVHFRRESSGFAAEIRGAAGASVRTLQARTEDCRALAQATALTLALLLDADVVAVEPEPAALPPAPPPVPKLETREPEPRREAEARREHATFALGGVATAGVLRALSPGVVADAGVELARFRASLGALWLVPHHVELGPGELRQSLLAGAARSCVAFVRFGATRYDVCTGILIGSADVRARGFSRNDHVRKPWIAWPVELAVSRLAPGFGWDVALGALVPIRSYDFSVDGLGVAYSSPPLGALLTLRAVGVLAL